MAHHLQPKQYRQNGSGGKTAGRRVIDAHPMRHGARQQGSNRTQGCQVHARVIRSLPPSVQLVRHVASLRWHHSTLALIGSPTRSTHASGHDLDSPTCAHDRNWGNYPHPRWNPTKATVPARLAGLREEHRCRGHAQKHDSQAQALLEGLSTLKARPSVRCTRQPF